MDVWGEFIDVSILTRNIQSTMQPAKTLELGSLRDQIRARLEKDILEGALRPGVAIDEKALALSFHASRTRCAKRCSC